MNERYVDTPEQLAAVCRELSASAWLAVDTEFMREKTYYPVVCLIQVANADLAVAVDLVKLRHWEPLLDLLYRDDILKVFHAASQDLEIFQLLRGDLPAPLFDTQPAASLLGYGEQLGYGDLVYQELGVALDKGHGRTDWMARPLSPAQLRYALDDVIYLGKLYQRIQARLQEQGRYDWLKDEFGALTDPARYQVEPMDAWRKLRGRNRLRGKQLAVLQYLAGWREEQAKARNLPRKWVVRDDLLLELARRMPQDMSALMALRGLDKLLSAGQGEELLARIRAAGQLPASRWPREKAAPPKLDEQQQLQVDQLTALLQQQADHHHIHAASLGNRKQLERLVAGERDIPLLKGWRRELAGGLLLHAVEG